MKKIVSLVAVIVGIMLVSAPVASAALTQDEATQIRVSAANIQPDLTNLYNSYQVYNLLLRKIALELTILQSGLNLGQTSTEQADVALANIRAEVANAVSLKASLETTLSSVVTRVNALVVQANTYTND